MLASARDNYLTQQRIVARGVLDAQEAARKGPTAVAASVALYQIAAARTSATAVPAMLAEQGIQSQPVGSVAATALAGVTSAGFPLTDYFAAFQSLKDISLAVATQLQDTGRNAAAVAIAARPDIGYVRMLNPPSCSRCVVLAGKWFKWNAGFERHPKCDCRHIPSTEAGDWHGLTVNPEDYFHSLPTATELDAQYPALTVAQRRKRGLYSQEDIFTVAGAQAIREGADIGQVVNARRGMRKAQLYGRDAFITLEGTTRHGLYGSSAGSTVRQAEELATRITRTGPELRRVHRSRVKRARLMPETIMAVAKDRADAQRLLKLYGYII